jgi:hypothetical protein
LRLNAPQITNNAFERVTNKKNALKRKNSVFFSESWRLNAILYKFFFMGITAQQIHDELKKGGVVVKMKNE